MQTVLTSVGGQTPPLLPVAGEVHALGPALTGEWSGQGGTLAQWQFGQWQFITPQEGWRAWDLTDGVARVYSGGAWTEALQNLAGLGIGTTSDAQNLLAVAAPASLLSHAGADHQLKINKDDIRNLYEKYALSTKLYSELTVGVNEEVSDDDARIMQVMQIVVSNNSKATKISEKLGQGTDFTSLANLYNEQQQIETFISRKDVPSSMEKVVFLMDNNQISPCIEAEKKYYFYKVKVYKQNS